MDGESLTLFMALGWIVAGGVAGGICDLLFHIRLGEKGFEHKPQFGEMGFDIELGFLPFLGLILASASVGSVGAIGVQAAFIALDRFSEANSIENVVYLLGISAVAGFGARRFLPRLRDRLDDEIREVKKEAREASEDAQEAKEEIKVFAALRPGALDSEREICIEHLRKELETNPLNRTHTIILGRLLRVSGDLRSAISVLTRFINRRDQLDDKDIADALYNRACYRSLLWIDEAAREGLVAAIKEDLEDSFKLSPENRRDAKRDEDFDAVRSIPELANLL